MLNKILTGMSGLTDFFVIHSDSRASTFFFSVIEYRTILSPGRADEENLPKYSGREKKNRTSPHKLSVCIDVYNFGIPVVLSSSRICVIASLYLVKENSLLKEQ